MADAACASSTSTGSAARPSFGQTLKKKSALIVRSSSRSSDVRSGAAREQLRQARDGVPG
eukprot:3555300-Prymnesium_polylepis.1